MAAVPAQAAPLKEVADWAERYRRDLGKRLNRLDTYLQELKARRRDMAVSSVANSDTFQVTTPSEREIRMTRLFDAPRHLVFEAMSKPEHIRQWWGRLGEGYSVPVCEVDLRAGRGVALRQPAPEGRGRVPRRVSRDRTARTRGVHRDLRAVSRRGISRDGRAHRGERQDSPDGDVASIRRSEVRDMVLGPAWRRAPPSATTGSRIWSPRAAAARVRLRRGTGL